MRASLVTVLVFFTHQALAERECVVIANGAPLPLPVMQAIAHTKIVIAADGAVKTLRDFYQSQVRPDFVIGDFDSCSEADRGHFADAQIMHVPSQELNDLEKGIEQCDALGARHVWLLNALGLDRLDHTLAAIHILKKVHKSSRRLRLVSVNQILEFVKDEELSFESAPGEAVGVFGFDKASVTSRGLQYEMTDYQVADSQFSSSNYVVAPRVFIGIKGEAIVSYPRPGIS